jgi:hypothetical protein
MSITAYQRIAQRITEEARLVSMFHPPTSMRPRAMRSAANTRRSMTSQISSRVAPARQATWSRPPSRVAPVHERNTTSRPAARPVDSRARRTADIPPALPVAWVAAATAVDGMSGMAAKATFSCWPISSSQRSSQPKRSPSNPIGGATGCKLGGGPAGRSGATVWARWRSEEDPAGSVKAGMGMARMFQSAGDRSP